MVKKFSTPLATFEVSDGVVYSIYLPDKVNLEQVKEHVSIMLAELKEGAPFVNIADISKADRSNNKELRDYLNTPELNALSKATAVVADSIIARISANLYLRFAKTTTPTKFFATKEDALVWVQQFK
jgi:hypothetical protein